MIDLFPEETLRIADDCGSCKKLVVIRELGDRKADQLSFTKLVCLLRCPALLFFIIVFRIGVIVFTRVALFMGTTFVARIANVRFFVIVDRFQRSCSIPQTVV